MGSLKPALLNVFDHLPDVFNLLRDCLADLFTFGYNFLEGFIVRLFVFHLLDQRTNRLKILFYLFKQPLDIIFYHFEDFWLYQPFENSLVHWGEIIKWVLHQRDISHKLWSEIKNFWSLVGEGHLYLWDLFEVSIKNRLEIKLISFISIWGKRCLRWFRPHLFDWSSNFLDAFSGSLKISLEALLVLWTLDRTNLAHEKI